MPDRKSTRLNSSHLVISYAVFCLKKKKKTHKTHNTSNTVSSGANGIAEYCGVSYTVSYLGAATVCVVCVCFFVFFFFFFNDTATTEIYTLSLHDALPI